MYAKLIKCDVVHDKKDQFSMGQECWNETANAKGFIKQFGGWDGDQAIILALWNDKASIEGFMQTLHDPIADKANQTDSYSAISVSYLNQVMDIPTHSKSEGLNPQLIRIADCKVIEDKQKQFLDIQRNVWNGRMSAVKGMLGGHVWQSEKDPMRFLVITFWQSETCHQNYMTNHFPELKVAAKTDSHISELSGHTVLVQRSWNV